MDILDKFIISGEGGLTDHEDTNMTIYEWLNPALKGVEIKSNQIKSIYSPCSGLG